MRGRWLAPLALALAACAAPDDPGPPPPEAAPAATGDGGTAPSLPARPPFAGPETLRSLFGEAYEEALAAVGLAPAEARCTPPDLAQMGDGRFRLPLYEAIQGDPTLSDRYARVFREAVLASAPSAEALPMLAAGRLGSSVRLTLLGDPLKEEEKAARREGALEEALHSLGNAESRDRIDASSVPPGVQAAAALVLRAAKRAEPWLEAAFEGVPDLERYRAGDPAGAFLLLAAGEDDPRAARTFERVAAAVDLAYLARAAAEVALAADRAAEWLRAEPATAPFEYRRPTRLGEVLLRGGGDDADGEDDGGPFLLRIDTGGNDRYRAGAAGAPVSVLIDAAGDDRYEAPPGAAAFGAGVFGVGILLDEGGNDRYALRGERSLGLGAGAFGFGILRDREGDDAYEGDRFCMGAGAAGVGTLADLSGSEDYRAYQYAQGFGFVRGCGVLADLSGNDRYEAVDGKEPADGPEDRRKARYPSPQSADHNVSLCQGAAYGNRADYLDGHSLAGGVGILADGGGDDRYSCGVFGQGVGYWMGVGMLLDGGGDDAYAGAWYVQGASAHYAVGILEDASGDDAYHASMNMAQGAGHDYSVGVLLDRAGNDRHRAPNLSLGGGNACGIGLFVDGGGDDSYESRGVTLGLSRVATPARVPSLRHGSLSLGVFLDLGGTDHYEGEGGGPAPFAGDGRLWTQGEREPGRGGANERGVGLDR